MKRTLVAALAAILVSGLVSLAGTPPAQAANRTPGCITKAEFEKIRKGKPMRLVRRIVGARGNVSSSANFATGDAWRTLRFRQCGRSMRMSSVHVDFEKKEREVYVPDVYCFDWDGDGYEEDCEDYGTYETQYSWPLVVTSKYAFWF